ncbi:unnamed protein product, partial [Didymodactylos carnosus]
MVIARGSETTMRERAKQLSKASQEVDRPNNYHENMTQSNYELDLSDAAQHEPVQQLTRDTLPRNSKT